MIHSQYLPLLSIIIPTKNRYKTLIPVIKSILKNINTEQIELVIQDNSDDNKDVLNYFNSNIDSRLKYFYISKNMSIAENTIAATENAKGKYLIFIGDDDIVAPDIIDFVYQLDEIDGDCLIYSSAFYWWDSVEFKRKTHYHRNNTLWLPQNISKDFKKLSSKIELESMLKLGAVGYFSLPRYYHGIVKKTVLDSIKIATGSILPGSCPDISFATSISLVIDEYYFINYPLSVFGASKNSGGGFTASKKHFGKIEDQPFLRDNILQEWDPMIPKIWSERTIYPQTVFEVLKEFDSKLKINYTSFYSSMFVYETYLFKYLLPVLFNYLKKKPFKFIPFVYLVLKNKLSKWYNMYKASNKKMNFDVYEVSEIDKVMEVLSKSSNKI
jgi:glycosyltransferase involved in cell wall biosynthesis